MSTKTVNISFQKGLLDNIDKVARKESRSRSELLREAARIYIERKQRWGDLFAYFGTMATRRRLSGRDVDSEIRAYRRNKGSRR